MTPNELIHRYLLGTATPDEVRELEQQMQSDPSLQDEFLMQAEIDAHLRQEAQGVVTIPEPTAAVVPRRSPIAWRWIAGISTLAATILLLLMLSNFPSQRSVFVKSFLGHFVVNVPWEQQNLWSYAGRGDVRGLRSELKRDTSINARIDNGLTPLHLATLYDRREAVEVLLAAGAERSPADSKGNTPLHMAAFLANADIVDVLLKNGADPNERNGLGFDAVDLVSFDWDAELVAYYQSVEQSMNTRLDLRRIRADRPKVLELLEQADASSTPTPDLVRLWNAAIKGDVAAIKTHVRNGTPLNEREGVGGSTPLLLSATFGQSEVASLLITAGADLEIRNNSGNTALHVACFFGHPEIVDALLQAGANPASQNSLELTALDTITIPWDSELEAIYRYVYESLGLKFDVEQVKESRRAVTNVFQQHLAKQSLHSSQGTTND